MIVEVVPQSKAFEVHAGNVLKARQLHDIACAHRVNLEHHLQLLAVDADLFPRAQRYVPDSWRRLRTTLKKTPGTHLNMAQVQQLAVQHNVVGKDVLRDCLQFLTDTGEIIWWSHPDNTQHLIFHRPTYIVDVLRCLLHHDLDTHLDFEENKIFAAAGGFTRDTFQEAKAALVQSGHMSRPLLQCLWFHLRLDHDGFQALCELVTKLNLAYQAPHPDNEMHRTDYLAQPILVVPSWVSDAAPDESPNPWSTELSPHATEAKLVFRFPMLFPAGLLEKMSCRLQGHVTERVDWRRFIWVKTDGVEAVIELQEQEDTEAPRCLSVIVRGTENADLQKFLECFCEELHNIIGSMSGLTWTVAASGSPTLKVSFDLCFSCMRQRQVSKDFPC